MVTFAVHDVTPAAAPLRTQPLGELYADALAIGVDPAMPVIVPNVVHPLLDAVVRAVAGRRPLILTPDAIWLTITQGLAWHIRLYTEELRPVLADHAGRRQLHVNVDTRPTTASEWQYVIERFGELNGTDLFECDFTTSTEIERTAGKAVLFDAYTPYFATLLGITRGIPSITLTGTVEDWRSIRSRVDELERFGLRNWCRTLRPITYQFIRAAQGNVDKEFWQHIYGTGSDRVGPAVRGWITRFYPYLHGADGAVDMRNPLMKLPIADLWEAQLVCGEGISVDRVPCTLAKALVTVNDQANGENETVALYAGLVGVAQENDGALRPIVGWHLTPAPIEIDSVIDRLVEQHDTTPALDRGLLLHAPTDLVAIDRRIGSAALFGWRLRPNYDRPRISRHPSGLIKIVIDLPDGRHLGYTTDYKQWYWVACRIDGSSLADAPEDIPVYGTSLALLLDAAMDFNGDISSLKTSRLADLEST